MLKTLVTKITTTTVAVSMGILGALCIVATPAATAATLTYDVTSIQLGSLADAPDSTVNGVTYLNQSLSITSLTANSIDWIFGSSSTPAVTLKRGGYAPPSDDTFGNYNNRQVILSERFPSDPDTTVRIPQPTTTEAVLSQNSIIQGAENVFVNAGFIRGLQTDIERVDFVFSAGLETSPKRATVILDRGLLAAHDGFQIAPILSIDNAGNPTSYGSLISIAAGWGNTNLRPGGGANDNLPYPELTNSTGTFSVVNSVSQQIGGVLLPLSAFSATPTTIYGYSLFSPDVNDGGNSANLLDFTNAAVFPQNTPNNVGGLDLIAGSGQVVETVPEPSTILGSLAVGSLLAALKRKRVSSHEG